MPQVKLKINCWLRQGLEANSAGFEEIPISAPEGESVLGLISRFASENGVFRSAIFDEKNQEILSNIVVILNGRIVNPHECYETMLKEDDVVALLPMVSGG